MERYICIHGHFYQPPRENPWLESIELQYSAYPYHDWNERVCAECYAPNATSRILDEQKRIIDIVNNYSKISFDFGPTLLAWMEINAPEVYQAVLDADLESQHQFSGHGAALAQAYNHMVMPLANRRDKYTQVIWGIRDFEKRFHRFPEGMWLPETAVDLETLDIMAELGIKFTVLAPHQARRIRLLDSDNWEDVDGSHIDPSMSYRVNLPSGRNIAVFFYDGPISQSVAFEGLLSSGGNFANRLTSGFSDQRSWPQLVHIATDGESYGHHHRFGDMALAYALDHLAHWNSVKITNYGEFLDKHPPAYEAEIIENTSWSCIHGIERWRSDCGCNTGGHPGWNQQWRAPLRQALDWLRDEISLKYEEYAGKFLKDPWQARDNYINLVLSRSPQSTWDFFAAQAKRELKSEEVVIVLKLLELQRHAMLMYTSCGWFFDELSGIETVQVIQYAGRVVQLAQELFGDKTEEKFLKLLEAAKSNIPENGDGRHVYEKFVKPAMIDLHKVAAHYAISSLFEKYPDRARIYCYGVDMKASQELLCGKTRGIIGRARFTSEITQESETISFGVLHFGDHNVNAGVRKYKGKRAYEEMLAEMTRTCSIGDFPGTVRMLDKHFTPAMYSLKTLFRDEQNKVLNSIIETVISEAESAYQQVYQSDYPLMRFLTDLDKPLPEALRAAADFVVNTDLRHALAALEPDFEKINRLLDDSKLWKVQLDTEGLAHVFHQTLNAKMAYFVAEPENYDLLNEMESLVDLAGALPFAVDFRQIQNSYFGLFKMMQARREAGEQTKTSNDWGTRFLSLGEKLSMQVS
jgi:alpha-amylase/alpha-mannosidase (GH57 family)